MTNWPNTIQCLCSDAAMSLGIKSFATEGVHDKVQDKVHDQVHDWYQDLGIWYQDLWGNWSCMMGEPLSWDTLTDIHSEL